MGERLWEVSQGLAGRSDLLGIQADVVGVGEHLLEHQPSLGHPARAGERFDVPERAQVERAFVSVQTVAAVGGVTAYQTVADEVLTDAVEG